MGKTGKVLTTKPRLCHNGCRCVKVEHYNMLKWEYGPWDCRKVAFVKTQDLNAGLRFELPVPSDRGGRRIAFCGVANSGGPWDARGCPTAKVVDSTDSPDADGRTLRLCHAEKVVVDSATLLIPGPVEIRSSHEGQPIGFAEVIMLRQWTGDMAVWGFLHGDIGNAGRGMIDSPNPIDWALSIGARGGFASTVKAGKSTTVNRRVIHGPANIVRYVQLEEVSFVPRGADEEAYALLEGSQEFGRFHRSVPHREVVRGTQIDWEKTRIIRQDAAAKAQNESERILSEVHERQAESRRAVLDREAKERQELAVSRRDYVMAADAGRREGLAEASAQRAGYGVR